MTKFHHIITLIFVASSVMVQAQNSPLMGWSSWNTYRVNINDSLICSQADALIGTGLHTVGYKYINIDDGYFGGRDKEGQLLIHAERFPRGLKPVVQHIHQLGLKAGIYSDAGCNTCGSFWDADKSGVGVGMYGHDQQDADFFFRQLGFDFIKVDFCGGDAKQNAEQLQLSERERYTAIRDAINKTGKKDVRLNVCRWDYPGTWVSQVADSWRISHDISPSWGSVKDIIHQNLYLSAFASEGHYNDMDMLEVGRGMTEEEDRTHFGLWCMMCSPLLIGCDITTIQPATLTLLSNPELIALNQQAPHQQAYVVSHTDECYVLVKDIEQPNGNRRAVAFYNPTDQATRITLSLADICLKKLTAIRDLYERQNVSPNADNINITNDSLSVLVPAHGTRIYALTAEQRTERSIYEAETAYLGAYQELVNHQVARTAIFVKRPYYSGGVGVEWLGFSNDNNIQWTNVYRTNGGNCHLDIVYAMPDADAPQSITISINSQPVATRKLPVIAPGTTATLSLDIDLKAGQNSISLSNPSGPMPAIDYIRIL